MFCCDPNFWGVEHIKKVAIVAKAPSTRMKAPYNDPTWQIWSLSDNYNEIPRWDQWFEIHDLDRYKNFYKPYYDWLCKPTKPTPIWVNDVREEMPAAKLFPWQQIVKEWGDYFNNSVSWMLIWAACHGAEEISLWGVDMSVDSLRNQEYAHQRPSCEYHIGLLRGLGVNVYVPPESDLLKTFKLYGVEANRGTLDQKLRVREDEIKSRIWETEREREMEERASYAASGAMHMLIEVRNRLQSTNGDAEKDKLLDWVSQGVANLEKETSMHRVQERILLEKAGLFKGCREDLLWCRQWI